MSSKHACQAVNAKGNKRAIVDSTAAVCMYVCLLTGLCKRLTPTTGKPGVRTRLQCGVEVAPNGQTPVGRGGGRPFYRRATTLAKNKPQKGAASTSKQEANKATLARWLRCSRGPHTTEYATPAAASPAHHKLTDRPVASCRSAADLRASSPFCVASRNVSLMKFPTPAR